MRLLIYSLAAFIVANLNTGNENSGKKLWEVVWDYLVSGSKVHADSGLSISQFLDKYQYPLEFHEVTTEDGYILTLHRVPHGTNKTEEIQQKPAILLVHCLACSSMDWIWQGPNRSLGLILADKGYDVWLANTRGNAHSLNHETLTPQNASYWDFSFHEKGYYDMAANIDYILNVTGLSNITYIGHSQGTTDGLVLTSSRPEYNEKLNLMVLLSPIGYLEHMASPLVQLLVDYNSLIKTVLHLFNIYGYQYNPFTGYLGEIVCNENSPLQGLCILVMDLFAGFDFEQVDKSALTVFLTNSPNGISYRDIEHYTQEVTSAQFRQYDYGNSISNFIHYGQSEPPSYNISNIKVPLAVYYAKNDFMAAVEDVERLLSELQAPIVEKHLIEYEKFNHLDFIIAKDVKKLLYDRVLSLIQKQIPVI
ncbi:lipase 3-like isoform X2 [Anthonomus grandis grandis]|uniref:lipase 3-like isoform X2 n=1 Tax=Anthonomus grandis grandis TaxID=2921223 RepID=UPI002165FF24|nr:lipase 3-like isoform X2 [Anthonomus grandis grandis]